MKNTRKAFSVIALVLRVLAAIFRKASQHGTDKTAYTRTEKQ